MSMAYGCNPGYKIESASNVAVAAAVDSSIASQLFQGRSVMLQNPGTAQAWFNVTPTVTSSNWRLVTGVMYGPFIAPIYMIASAAVSINYLIVNS